jgi:hypothetical protein
MKRNFLLLTGLTPAAAAAEPAPQAQPASSGMAHNQATAGRYALGGCQRRQNLLSGQRARAALGFSDKSSDAARAHRYTRQTGLSAVWTSTRLVCSARG